MSNWAFTQGVHDIGNGIYGYVQPDGTWGWSNAGLIVSAGQTLLVDTLMSRALTRTILDDFAKVPGGGKIDRLVNTHANPDHFVGNGLVEGAEIIATAETAREMAQFNPPQFDWSDLDSVAMPNRTFEGALTVIVGEKRVELTAELAAPGVAPSCITQTNVSYLFWTLSQMVAHQASNGAPIECGDLIGTGTVSGPDPKSRACLAEITLIDGEQLALADGSKRTMLLDGDTLTIRGRAVADGFISIGFGECAGTIHPARRS